MIVDKCMSVPDPGKAIQTLQAMADGTKGRARQSYLNTINKIQQTKGIETISENTK